MCGMNKVAGKRRGRKSTPRSRTQSCIRRPSPEGEGSVEEADVGEAGFAEEGFVVLGGEDGEFFADGGAGGFCVGRSTPEEMAKAA